MSNVRWLPLGIKKIDWENAGTKTIILAALCEFIGVPNNDIGKADVQTKLNPTLIENVVGNAELGINAGDDYFISANSCANYLGNNTEWAQDKLNRLKDSAAKDYILIAEWTPDCNAWIGEDYWGLVTQNEPEI